MEELLLPGDGHGECDAAVVRGGAPAAHVGADHGADGTGGVIAGFIFSGAGEECGVLPYEVCGALGVVECGVVFAVCFFAAVVKDGGCDDGIVCGGAGEDAAHVEEVEGELHHGFGVAHEAALPQGVGGVVFAGGAGGHGPEAGGAVIEDAAHEGADL